MLSTSPVLLAMFCALTFALAAPAGVLAQAGAQKSAVTQTRNLSWDDLIPESVDFEDPFEELSREQLEYLGFVARIRAMIAAGTDVSEGTRQELAEIEAELAADGVDVDTLLGRRDELRELRRKRATGVVQELNEVPVTLSGYVMPVGALGGGTAEFLLVPWAAECVHTPLPPANQIVHVVLEAGEALDDPDPRVLMVASGVLHTQRSTQNLLFADGSSELDALYQLRAARIEVLSP